MRGAILTSGIPCLLKGYGQFNQSSGQKLLVGASILQGRLLAEVFLESSAQHTTERQLWKTSHLTYVFS
jgi:hypothetical protein